MLEHRCDDARSHPELGHRCAHYGAQSRNARQPQWPPQCGRLPTDIRACARDSAERKRAQRCGLAVTWVGAQLTLLYCVNEVVPAAECAGHFDRRRRASGTAQAGLRKRDWDRVSIVIGGKLGRRTGVATRRCHAGSDPRSWSPHPCLRNQPHRLSALGLTGIASACSAEPGLTLRARLNRDRRGRARALMAACPILYMAWARGAGAWTGPCTRERQVRKAPSAGADAAGVSPVPVQMWRGRARSRCRCGQG